MRHRKKGRQLSQVQELQPRSFAQYSKSAFSPRFQQWPFTELERLIPLARRGDVHARRLAATKIQDREVLGKLFDEIAPRYIERPGGYTRVLKLGNRKGDAAEMSLIELVG